MSKIVSVIFGADALTTILGLFAAAAVFAADYLKALPDLGPGWQLVALVLAFLGRLYVRPSLKAGP